MVPVPEATPTPEPSVEEVAEKDLENTEDGKQTDISESADKEITGIRREDRGLWGNSSIAKSIIDYRGGNALLLTFLLAACKKKRKKKSKHAETKRQINRKEKRKWEK